MNAGPRESDGPTRLLPHRNPLRQAVSGSTWLAAWYLLANVIVGWVLWSVVVTVSVTALALTITVIGIPMLIAAAGVVRGCANAERARLAGVLGRPVRGSYRAVAGSGIVASARRRWSDPATWRDVAYLVGVFPFLWVLDAAAFTVWLTFLGGITMPAWYWSLEQTYPGGSHHGVQLGYFPNGPGKAGAAGLYVDTLPKALLAAAIFLILFLIFNYALAGTARLHARVAYSLLRAPADPMAPAKDVLSRPGPLGSLRTAGPGDGPGQPSAV